MPAQILVALLLTMAFAVYAARQIAIAKQRSATGWMWAAAVFPPAVIPLTLLPKRATHSEASS